MKITTPKSKLMAFNGQVPIMSNTASEQVNAFIRSGCKVS